MWRLLNGLMNFLNFAVSISAIITLIWFHGYHYRPEYLSPHYLYLHICLGFFFLHYIYRASSSGDFGRYLKDNRVEYLLLLFLLLEFLLNRFLYFSFFQLILFLLGIENHNHVFVFSLHICLLILVGIEMGKASARSTIWKLSPPLLFIFSFLVLVIVGSSLFMLPEMTADGKGMDLVDALFTSVSANCVTGLIVVDTGTYFSVKGEMLILLFMQLGGLNITAFASYFIARYHAVKTSQREDAAVMDLMQSGALERSDVLKLMKRVILVALILECIGAIVLFFLMGDSAFFSGIRERIFFSVFHSVSAFNNAGFSLFTDGLTHPAVINNYGLHIALAVLVVLGGLGFTTLWDLVFLKSNSNGKISGRKFKLDGVISIAMALILITVGALLFFALEYQSVLDGHSGMAVFTKTMFQSITARTAGFNSVDVGQLTIGGLILLMVLMFIGGGSGSTAGGIKTSTFFILLHNLGTQLKLTRKKSRLYTGGMLKKARDIALYSLLVIVFGTILLSFAEPDKRWLDLLFEEFSAYGTVGLSTGITRDLSVAGKIIVMTTILIGRVGPVTLAYTMVNRPVKPEIEEQGFMIG